MALWRGLTPIPSLPSSVYLAWPWPVQFKAESGLQAHWWKVGIGLVPPSYLQVASWMVQHVGGANGLWSIYHGLLPPQSFARSSSKGTNNNPLRNARKYLRQSFNLLVHNRQVASSVGHSPSWAKCSECRQLAHTTGKLHKSVLRWIMPDKVCRYISLVAASCMVLYGYDASVYNAVQGSEHWVKWFNDPDDNMIGLINTVYTIGAIISGFFFGGPVADYLGRRAGMGIGAILVIISTLLQTFSPRGNIGMFMAGRIIIGVGQGLALSKFSSRTFMGQSTNSQCSRGIYLHRRARPSGDSWQDYVSVADFLQCWLIHLL